MASFLLLPGSRKSGWYWHRVVDLLVRAGHEAVAVDFPARMAQERLGLTPERLPGGHLMALSHPEPLAAKLLSWL